MNNYIYINFHVCTCYKEMTCHVTCVFQYIIFHLSREDPNQAALKRESDLVQLCLQKRKKGAL